MTKRFVIVDIGCIECGEPTSVHGLFNTMEDAQTQLKLMKADGPNKREYENGYEYFAGGQHHVKIFEVTP